MKKSLNTSKKAFTIIELLIVIAIIAILTAIVMTNLTGSKAKARDAKRVSDLGQIQLALELFYDRCKSYPTALSLDDDALTLCPDGINLGTFIGKLPVDPTTLASYDYGATVIGSSIGYYFLKATLETQNPALQDDVDILPTEANAGEPTSSTVCADSPSFFYCVDSK